jgi:hypothetical protein
MTRDQMLEWCRQLKIPADGEDAGDRLYYLVALAIKQEREACLNDVHLERESWKRGRNDMAVIVCDYITQTIKKRGMS